MTAVIAVAGGTPHVGKTVLSANLAYWLSQKGNPTALLVAGSQTPVLGVAPQNTWPNIVAGRIPVGQSLTRDSFGVDMLVTQGHGHALGRLSTQATEQMMEQIRDLETYAYLIVDMAAGLTAPTAACCMASAETIITISADTASLTTAYDWLTRMARFGYQKPINMVLNQIKKPAMGQSIFNRFRDLAHKKLNMQVNLWGALSYDTALAAGTSHAAPLAVAHPGSKLPREIEAIADRLVAEQPPENQTQTLDIFWKAFLHRIQSLPQTHPDLNAQSPEPAVPSPPIMNQRPLDQGSGPPAAAQNDLVAAVDRLTAQLSEIQAEMGAIRHTLESHNPGQAPPGTEAAPPADTVTVLDFEAFVDARKEE